MSIDYKQEWNYLFQETLGIMCGVNDPTPEQIEQAMKYATEQVEKLKQANNQ